MGCETRGFAVGLAAVLWACAVQAQQATTEPNGEPTGRQPTLMDGLKKLGGVVDSILRPVASEFRALVKAGDVDGGLAYYDKQREAVKSNKELQGDIDSLLTSARSAKGAQLQSANARLAGLRESKSYVQEPLAYMAAIGECETVKRDYLVPKLLADNAASDTLVAEADAQLGQARQSLTADVQKIYEAFPHERGSFGKALGIQANEGELFAAGLPSLLARLRTLDDEGQLKFLANTGAAWKAEPKVRQAIATELLGKPSTDPPAVFTLRTALRLEKVGLKREDVANRPVYVLLSGELGADAPKMQILPGVDEALKAAPDLKRALDEQPGRRLVLLQLQDGQTSRRIADKREVQSKYVSGQTRIPNPRYDIARLDCQRAQAEATSQKMRNNLAPAKGWGALFQALSEGAQQSTADRSCQQFASTPPIIEEDVLTSYTYVVSDVEVTKKLNGTLLAIDAARSSAEAYPIGVQDQYTYSVAYGKKPNDKGTAQATITDEDLESEIAAPIKVDPVALLGGLQDNVRRSLDKREYQALLSVPVPTAVAGAPARPAGNATPNLASDAPKQFVNLAAASPAKQPAATQQDDRVRSVVVVLNPKGSLGAGFYVDTNDIITNQHVVENTTTVELRDSAGQQFTGRVVRRDIQLDLALIRVERSGVPVQFYGSIVRPGDTVDAVGHPQGLSFSLTRGVVSAVRQVKGALAPGGDKTMLIQIDTAINPGNSGGPLFIKDRVVGVNTMKMRSSEGIGFALHYSEVVKFLSSP